MTIISHSQVVTADAQVATYISRFLVLDQGFLEIPVLDKCVYSKYIYSSAGQAILVRLGRMPT